MAAANEITLYDQIGGWGVTAGEFKEQLDAITGDQLILNLNSPGGDVFDGIAMYNDLADHPAEVTVRIQGLAASAASLIAMAGDKIEIADGAFLMIHNAWGLSVGNKNRMREVADLLDEIDDALAGIYVEKTGLKKADIAQMMDDETWFNAEDAVTQGFADTKKGDNTTNAAFDLSVFNHAPTELLSEIPMEWKTKRDVERTLTQDAGFSRSHARQMIAATVTQDAGTDFTASIQGLINTIRG